MQAQWRLFDARPCTSRLMKCHWNLWRYSTTRCDVHCYIARNRSESCCWHWQSLELAQFQKNWIPGAYMNIWWSPQHQNSCSDLICTNFQWIPPNWLHSIAPNTCHIESLHCLFPSISLVQPDPVQVCIFQVLQLSRSTTMQGWHATCNSVCSSSMRSLVPCKSVQSVAENLRARFVLLQECKSSWMVVLSSMVIICTLWYQVFSLKCYNTDCSESVMVNFSFHTMSHVTLTSSTQ